LLRLLDEGAADAAALVLGRDGDPVEPAAVAVVARQRGAHHLGPGSGDEEQLGLLAAPALDDLLGRPPARVVVEHAAPERRDRRAVAVAKLADAEIVRHQRDRPATASAAASPLRTQSGMPMPRQAAPATPKTAAAATRAPTR